MLLPQPVTSSSYPEHFMTQAYLLLTLTTILDTYSSTGWVYLDFHPYLVQCSTEASHSRKTSQYSYRAY